MSDEFPSNLALSKTVRVEEMRSGEEISAMVRLHEVGWGAKRIAQEFGCARNTVRRYLREGGVVPYRQPVRRTALGLVCQSQGPLVEIVKRSDAAKGFVVLPRRWVVERTLAWLNRNRRLAKDFEQTIASATAWLFIASIQLFARRIARA